MLYYANKTVFDEPKPEGDNRNNSDNSRTEFA
jgi:hypothetical protein